jgi:TnpA family transposase
VDSSTNCGSRLHLYSSRTHDDLVTYVAAGITEENLNEAITRVINAYAQLPLQRVWGSGKSAAADGTKWDYIRKI